MQAPPSHCVRLRQKTIDRGAFRGSNVSPVVVTPDTPSAHASAKESVPVRKYGSIAVIVRRIHVPTRKQAPSRTTSRSGCSRPARTAQTPTESRIAPERTNAQESPSPSATETGTGNNSTAPAAVAVQPKRYKRSRVLKKPLSLHSPLYCLFVALKELHHVLRMLGADEQDRPIPCLQH